MKPPQPAGQGLDGGVGVGSGVGVGVGVGVGGQQSQPYLSL
ncbi:MAG TPA: hypothetical protein VN282_26480 [Pyrinomonadaceae bacterium]|nr:hypothetical protein [Pyrinomonadaceae bacterium]